MADKPALAVDIETFGLGMDARKLKCVTFASQDHAVVLDPRRPEHVPVIRDAFARLKSVIFHNSPFDVPNLARTGLMTVDQTRKVSDTLIFARLADPDERSAKRLERMGFKYLGIPESNDLRLMFKALHLSMADGYARFDLDLAGYIHNTAADAITTARLYGPIQRAAHTHIVDGHPFNNYGVKGPEAIDLVNREQIINRLFLRRAARGLRVDLDFLDQYRDQTAQDRNKAEQDLKSYGLEPGKAAQLVEFLDRNGAFPDSYPRTPKTKQPSTTAENLETLSHPVAQAYVMIKRIDKIQKDYLDKCQAMAENGRVHPATNILAATTGRMSMSDPPFQQFPEPARGTLIADEGDELTSIDWSQIEPVIMANVSHDQTVLDGYESGTSDVYTDVALRAGVSRTRAKVIVLAQLYGQGLATLAISLGIEVEEARHIKDAVFNQMPRVRKLMYKLRDIAEQHKKIFTLSGRIVGIPSTPDRGVLTHKGVNYFVQGSAYDVLADSLVRIEEAGLGDAVYLAMHDELVVSTSAAQEIRTTMETPPKRLQKMAGRVPVLRTDRADLGERWASV